MVSPMIARIFAPPARGALIVLALPALGALSALVGLAACASSNMLVGADSNECINVPWHGYQVDGTPVQLLHCRGHRNQFWSIGNGQITGIGGGCLDVQGSAPVDGAQIISVTCNGSPSQHWTVANGQITGIGGKCLDIQGGNKSDRAPLIIAPCNGSPSQEWEVH
jgi:hypothetical protein